MTVTYIKKASKQASTNDEKTGQIVSAMLREIQQNGESAALKYSQELDGYSGKVIVTPEQIEHAKSVISNQLKDDIAFAYERVTNFAKEQKNSISEFETEVFPGMWCAQKIIPLNTAGCYVPGGRYAHVASAIMSVATAKVAGVKNIVACSAPKDENGIDPGIMYTMDLCGADYILNLGGVQGIAAMAYGLFTGHKANILVGPGNRFVAEAKRQLFGQVGIDLFAGPTEVLVIADESADPHMVAVDLVGQAEHGPDSPCWLISKSEKLATLVMDEINGLIQDLPDTARQAAEASWGEYGEIILCDTDDEVVKVSDEYAAEHLELHTKNDQWYVDHLSNYGSLFIGEETTVAFGDKCSGTNHILPTKGAGKYTGGLSVHKFSKVVTTQRMTRQATSNVAAVAARISRLEGMEAHARTADARLDKYFSA